jgi:hypothetical protein
MADVASRAPRADEVRQERRRKPGTLLQGGMKLALPEERLDRKTYQYRWVKDYGARMNSLHEQDWDPAPEMTGSPVEKTGGTDEHGKPYNMVLMRKRLDWYNADQKEKLAPVEEFNKAIKGGTNHLKAEPELRDGTYTPGLGNVIERS